MENISDRFIELLYRRASEALPPEVERETRNCLLDAVGCMLGGSTVFRKHAEKYLDSLPKSKGVTVAGMDRKASLQDAALFNGVFAHAFDIDDGHRLSSIHLGATIIPALLAAAEWECASMEQLLKGIAVGYEAAIRLGRCMQPSHRNRGFHASGTLGSIGAAMGIAVLRGGSREDLKNVLSAACSNAGGILEAQENVSNMKPWNIGRAAATGVTSAYFGVSGFTGPLDPLNGKFGFLRAYCDEWKEEALEEDGNYSILGVYHKRHAACRHTHGSVDAVLELRRTIPAADVEKMTIRLYKQGIKGHDHTEIAGITAGKMSVPYCAAMAWVLGSVGIFDFTEENRVDPEILRLCRATEIVEDPELTAQAPGKRIAIVKAFLRDGSTVEKEMVFPVGEPENPMPEEAFRAKVSGMAAMAGKDESEIDAIVSTIMNSKGSVWDLTELL